MELCPYCEEDAVLDPYGDCPRCEQRHEVSATAAFFAETATTTERSRHARQVAAAVLTEPGDHLASIVNWARRTY